MKTKAKFLKPTIPLLLLFFSVMGQAQVQKLSTKPPAVQAADDGPWSANLLVRSISPNDTSGNALLNDLTINYNITKDLVFSVEGGFEQMTSQTTVQKSDFEDTEVGLTYTYTPQHIKQKWSFDFEVLGVLPTARYDQDTTEQGGFALVQASNLETSFIKITQMNRAYGYFYQYEETAKAGTPVVPTVGGDDDGGSVVPLVTTSNIAYYFDERLIAVVPMSFITKSWKLRNEFRYESSVHFNGQTQDIFHEKPGTGYEFSKVFSAWLMFDCAKSTTDGTSVFDAKNVTTLVTAFVNF
jgi:hypothetical protein